MSDYPSESSLVINATQQQLSESPFTAGVAISPSQREEAEGGYDIAFETASRLELQYKAVYSEIEGRSFEPGGNQVAVKFPFYGSQANTLLGRQTVSGTAFYALPVITKVSDLGNILSKTLFLDVCGLQTLDKAPCKLSEYTAFWVPVVDQSEENESKKDYQPTFSELYLKDVIEEQYSKPEAYHRIDGEYIYTWEDLKTLTSSNIAGVPLRINGKSEVETGYEELLSFEHNLLESKLQKVFFKGQKAEKADYHNSVKPASREISQKSIDTGKTILKNRRGIDELTPETREALSDHRYLLEPEFDQGRRQETVEAALVDPRNKDTPYYDRLDPRRGSRYRQYRFLTSGEKLDEDLTATIGFG